MQNLKEDTYDSYFIHLVGIDHAGHGGGMLNQSFYDIAFASIDEKLK